MNKILGICLIVVAVLVAIIVYKHVIKNNIYKGDFWHMIIDSYEFIIVIIALILLGIVFLKNG